MQISKRIILAIFLCFSVSCSAATPETDFQGYWDQFSAASLSNDYPALSKLIRFPLEIRGVDDSSPIEMYSKDQLNKIFPKLLSQIVLTPHGDELLETPLIELMKKKKLSINKLDKSARVEQFEFEFIQGKWYLVRAYLEE